MKAVMLLLLLLMMMMLMAVVEVDDDDVDDDGGGGSTIVTGFFHICPVQSECLMCRAICNFVHVRYPISLEPQQCKLTTTMRGIKVEAAYVDVGLSKVYSCV
jgi:hypothetical protein